MPVGRLAVFLRDGMNIQVEWTRRREDQALNPRFLIGLALSDPQHILVAVAMPAKLQPAIQFAMVMEQDLTAIATDHQRTPRKMRRETTARKTILSAGQELYHPFASVALLEPLAKIQTNKLPVEFVPVHAVFYHNSIPRKLSGAHSHGIFETASPQSRIKAPIRDF